MAAPFIALPGAIRATTFEYIVKYYKKSDYQPSTVIPPLYVVEVLKLVISISVDNKVYVKLYSLDVT
jgi:hypothetical protein